jgi:hypothetical protein
MRGSAGSIMLQQLVYQLPVLLVYMAGMIFATQFLKRYRVASILTLLATGTLIFAAIGTSAAQAYLIGSQGRTGLSAVQIGQMLSIIGIASSVLRAAAFGLLISAVFVGRDTQSPESLRAPQFGLRTMLIGMTLVCFVAGLISILIELVK